MKQISLFILLILQLSACSYFKRDSTEGKDAVARAYDYFLYPEDLQGLVPVGASREDSVAIIKNYIDNWFRQKVVLRKAERNLDDEKKDVEKKLEEYRNSLLTYAYETELVRQKLDTVINEEEIAQFYKNNQDNFELKDNIIKVIYLRLNKKSPKLNKVKDWYKSNVKKDRQLLEDYCRQYALNYFLDDNTWLLFDDLLKEIPIKTYDKEQFLQNNRIVEIEDSSTIYLVNIKGFMVKNSISPLSFERNNIKTIITNQRKLKLIEQMEKQAYEDAKKGNDVEVY
ncbi:MAG TPA: hypothetical protein PLI47_09000 [Bacteroidia bacterium]|nr:hypothetical protein [Bacteroidota bacterium]HQW00358.1 hypothetical protein [Bacteroidia bacterium]HQW23427.1 hypothetical protein [Bacteroidia bacterium]